MITVYGIANCDTVKKARAWLDARGVEYRFSDFKKTPPTAAAVRRWCEALGPEQVLNRRGTTWRALSAELQASATGTEGIVALLVAHPSAIRRPVVDTGSGCLIGFDADRFAEQAW